MTYPPENLRVTELDGKKFSEICHVLRPKWRDFSNALEEKKFVLSSMEIEKIAQVIHTPGDWNCAERLLIRLNERGMLVKHLIRYLRKLHLYAALQHLVPPEPLRIVSHSKDLSVEAGSCLTLHCQASSIPPPRYTWYHEQTQVQTTSLDTTLKIENVDESQEGTYVCGVMRDGDDPAVGTQWSGFIRVDVRPAPQRLPKSHLEPSWHSSMSPPLLPQPPLYAPRIVRQTGRPVGMECRLDYGSKLELECQAKGEPAPDFQWLMDGQELRGQTDPVLCIDEVRENNSGVYQCCIYNSQGDARSYQVTVKVTGCGKDRMEIKQHPSDLSVETSTKATFHVKAEGMNLKFQWYKDGSQVPRATEQMYIIDMVSADHRGSYQCKVSMHDDNDKLLKDMFSRPAQLTVTPRLKPAQAKGKVALVIGVSPERGTAPKLMCVINDCILITRKLRELDFKVMSYYDLSVREIRTAVDIFAQFLKEDYYGVVYLAGHGQFSAGQHYFTPVDPHEGSHLADYYCVEEMLTKLLVKNPKLLAVFLDMCRTAFPGADEEVHRAERFEPNDRGNLIIYHATLPYREALEPTIKGSLHEIQMPLEQPDSHGVLCKLLSQVMHRDIFIGKMFDDIQDALLESEEWRTMQTDQSVNAQIPTVQNNLLDWRVSLKDPLEGEHSSLDVWAKLSRLPEDQLFHHQGVEVRVSFQELLSTVLKVSIVLRALYPLSEGIRVSVDDESLPKVLQMQQCPTKSEQSAKLIGSEAVISRLHKHVGSFYLKLRIEKLSYAPGEDCQPHFVDISIMNAIIMSVAPSFQCAELEGRACYNKPAPRPKTGDTHGQEHDESYNEFGGD